MTYRVRIAPLPIVIDAEGEAIGDASVLDVTFPSELIDTPTGRASVIVGPGVAKITIAGETIRGVPLC